jgi:hypothetical protein
VNFSEAGASGGGGGGGGAQQQATGQAATVKKVPTHLRKGRRRRRRDAAGRRRAQPTSDRRQCRFHFRRQPRAEGPPRPHRRRLPHGRLCKESQVVIKKSIDDKTGIHSFYGAGPYELLPRKYVVTITANPSRMSPWNRSTMPRFAPARLKINAPRRTHIVLLDRRRQNPAHQRLRQQEWACRSGRTTFKLPDRPRR